MRLLGIDTSSENISLCIAHKGKIEFEFNRLVKFGASRLIVYINNSLRRLSLELKDIDAFVIGSGPGSFTGLRISFSVIKAFTAALGKPVSQRGSFFSCAYPFREIAEKIAVISDARRGLIYLASFKSKGGKLRRETQERLVTLKELREMGDYLCITYDSFLRKQILDSYPDINFCPEDIYPRAKYLMPFAENRCFKRKFIPLDKLKPLYLHPKTCQVRGV